MKFAPDGPSTPRMAHLLDEEVHLVASCGRCGRVVRLTPIEAVDAFGHDCTILQAMARLRCVWCGARRPEIDVRPCSLDMDARRQVHAAEHELRMWPDDPRLPFKLEEAKTAWEKRRPRDTLEGMCNLYTLAPNLRDLAKAFEQVLGLRLELSAGDATLANQPWAMTVYPKYQGLFARPVDPKNPTAGLEPASAGGGSCRSTTRAR